MPRTNFPNGVSTRTRSAENTSTGDGDLNCLDLFVDGTATITGAATFSGSLTVGTGTIVGETQLIVHNFSTASTAQVISLPIPWACNVVSTYVTMGSVSAVIAQYTVQAGSAGSVAVATVANTTASTYVQQGLATTATSVTTVSGLQVTRGVQGTAGDTAIGILVTRTA